MADMQIMVMLGADGAPFARALGEALDDDDTLDVVAPIVRDHWSAALKASPDLDALLTRPGVPPTRFVAAELDAIDFAAAWQRADDQIVAIRLVRTELLGSGYSLTDATTAAAARTGLPYRLLPMCEGRAELRVVVGGEDPHAIHIEDYLAAAPVHQPTELLLVTEGIRVSPAVSTAIQDTDVLVLGPSSRTLAIDPILRTPGLLELVRDDLPVLVVQHEDTAPADLVGVSGLRQPDPGRAESVPADVDAVLALARRLATR